MATKKEKLLKLDKAQTKEITDYVLARRAEKVDDVTIRTEVFKKFKIDLTLYKFNWNPKRGTHKGPVALELALTTTHNIRKAKAIISYEFPLTPEELAAKSERLTAALDEIETIDAEKKESMADFKSRLMAQNVIVKDCVKVLKKKTEPRQGECEIVKDFDAGSKLAYREGVLVKTEKLTQDDYTLFETESES